MDCSGKEMISQSFTNSLVWFITQNGEVFMSVFFNWQVWNSAGKTFMWEFHVMFWYKPGKAPGVTSDFPDCTQSTWKFLRGLFH